MNSFARVEVAMHSIEELVTIVELLFQYDGNKSLKRKTIKAICKDIGITVDELIKMLRL